MQCYAEQNTQLRPAGGISGESSICVATLAGSFIGDKMKTCSKCRQIKTLIRHPNRIQATTAVNEAIRISKLPRPDALICVLCWGQAEQYHHPSYEFEYWLEVIPVCKKCHTKIHKQFRKNSQ